MIAGVDLLQVAAGLAPSVPMFAPTVTGGVAPTAVSSVGRLAGRVATSVAVRDATSTVVSGGRFSYGLTTGKPQFSQFTSGTAGGTGADPGVRASDFVQGSEESTGLSRNVLIGGAAVGALALVAVVYKLSRSKR